MKIPALLACLLLALVPAAAPAQSSAALTVSGPDGRTVPLTAADVAKLPHVGFAFAAHGETHAYEGPLLIDVLALAGAPTGKGIRGPALADVVLVTAADGYQVALGLAEADPGTRPNRIILADRADGAPLDAKSGPLKLVVEGDLRPARGARGVVSLKVIALGAGAGHGDHAM
jgi:hypothetical protein